MTNLAPIIDCAFYNGVDNTCMHESNQTPECHMLICPRLAYFIGDLFTALKAHQSVGDHVEICPRCGVGASCVEYNGLAQKAIDLTKAALTQVEETQ